MRHTEDYCPYPVVMGSMTVPQEMKLVRLPGVVVEAEKELSYAIGTGFDRGGLVVSNSSALRIGSWRSVWIRHYRIVLCCFPVHDFDLMRQQLLRRYVFPR